MNRIFVLKDVAYAAKVGGGTITDYKEVNDLAPGALAFLTEDGLVLTAANAAASLPDVKTIQIASGRAGDTSLISRVPRRDIEVNNADYRAFVKKIITLGNLPVVLNEEGGVNVSDISYTSRYNVRTQRGSDYKTSSKTVEQSIDAIVAKLNAPSSFVVATKVDTEGVAEQFTIQVTAAATAAGNATVDIDGVTTNLALTITTIAANTAEITAVIDALPGWTATDDGVDTVTAVAVANGTKVDVANYTAGGATTSAATLATTVQGVTSTNTLFNIEVTPKDEEVDIDASLTGSFALAPKVITTPPIYGIGRGVDIIQMEKDFSPEMGNANYQDLTDLWNTTPLEGVIGSAYDVVSILWEGQHSSPTRTKSVMKNRAVIACLNGVSGGQNATDVLTLTALIFGTAYTATGVEPGTSEATDHDGIAGN